MSRDDDLRVRDLVRGDDPPPRRRVAAPGSGGGGEVPALPQVVVETGGGEEGGARGLPFDPLLVLRGMWRRRALAIAVFAASVVLSLSAAMLLRTTTWRVWTTVLRKSEQKEYLVTGTQPIVKLQIYSMPTLLRLVKVSANLERALTETGVTGIETAELSRRITVDNPKDTQLIEIILEWPDPDQAVALVDALARVFVAEVDRLQKAEAIEAYDYLSGELTAVRERISGLEVELVKFKEENEVVELSEQTGRLLAQLAEFDALARKERLDAEMARIAVERTTAELAGQDPTVVASTFVKRPVHARLVELEAELAAARSVYTDETAKVRELVDEIGRVQELVRRGMEEDLNEQTVSRNPVVASLEQTLVDRRVEAASRSARAEGYERVVADLRERLRELPALESRFAELAQQLDTLRELEGVVASRVEEVRIIRDSTAGNLSIMQPARRPTYPEPSGARLIALGGTVGGLGLALGLVLALELADRRLRALAEVEGALGVRPLGEIPVLEPGDVLLCGRRTGGGVEAYRRLATVLLQERRGARGWVVMVTSADAFEGRTTVTANLAAVAAGRGLAVTVVDADIVNPGLSDLAPRLGIEPATVGLAELLRGRAGLAEARSDGGPGLPRWVLAGGPAEPEALAGPRLADVLEELRDDSDLVLLDGPPVLLSSDAQLVAPHVDAVVIVAEAMGPPRTAHREAVTRLEAAGARVLGVVLNKVPTDHLGPFAAGVAGALRATAVAVLALALAATACTSSAPVSTPTAPTPTVSPTPTPAPQIGAVLPAWESIEAARGVGPGEYRIASGDVVDIMVFGHEDMRKELPVRPDGRISYLLVGDVEAAGRTVEELRADLEGRLARYLRYPQVDVVLKKARESSFSVLGEVVRPGVYPIQGPTTLVDGIALAQGLASGQYEGSTIETADLAHAFLVRRGKVVPIDFERVIHRGDTTQNVELEDGDFVYIPSSLAQEVYVLGEVFDPRSFGFRGRVTLLQAVSESGGFRPEARLGDVVVLRGVYGAKRLIPVDVREIIRGRAADPELEVGDVVYVPRRRLATVADTMRDILSTLLVYQSVDNLSRN